MIAPAKASPTRAISHLHLAVDHAIRRGNARVAKRLLKRWVKVDRLDAEAWERYGAVHYEAGNYALAVAAFERAVAMRPLSLTHQVQLALAYVRTGREQSAVELLTTLAGSSGLEPRNYLQTAVGLDAVGRTHMAINACRAALRADPDYAQAYFDLGYYCSRAGMPKSTVESLMRKALKCEPRNVRFQVGLACLLFRQDRLDDAWLLVRDLGSTAISSMTCACCLERLIELYRRADDQKRLTVSHQRLVELRLNGCGFDC